MVLITLFLSALIALSDTLVIPTSPEGPSAQNNGNPARPLSTIKAATTISDAASSLSNTLSLLPIPKPNKTTTTPPATPLTIWPPLPLTIDTGRNLNITITTLGLITSRTHRNEILNAISDLYHAVATEGDPYETIRGVYARSSGIVWTIFGCRSEVAPLKRFQVIQVLSAVWFLMFDYGPREVVASEVVSAEGVGVGTFVLRFSQAGG